MWQNSHFSPLPRAAKISTACKAGPLIQPHLRESALKDRTAGLFCSFLEPRSSGRALWVGVHAACRLPSPVSRYRRPNDRAREASDPGAVARGSGCRGRKARKGGASVARHLPQQGERRREVLKSTAREKRVCVTQLNPKWQGKEGHRAEKKD